MLPNENLDPWEKMEENSANKDYVYFGKVLFDITQSAWEDQNGKPALVPFDPATHKSYVMSIEINFDAVPGSPQPKYPQRTTDKTADWYNVTLPSIIKNLQIPTREIGRKLHNQYVKVIGEKYEFTKKDGSIKNYYPLKFMEIYPDEITCQAASDAFHGSNNYTEQPTVQPATNGNAEREVALKFLPALATQAGKDPLRMAELLAGNNLVGKYFTINSPEVIAVLS